MEIFVEESRSGLEVILLYHHLCILRVRLDKLQSKFLWGHEVNLLEVGAEIRCHVYIPAYFWKSGFEA
jgi:hypothetical protein